MKEKAKREEEEEQEKRAGDEASRAVFLLLLLLLWLVALQPMSSLGAPHRNLSMVLPARSLGSEQTTPKPNAESRNHHHHALQ